MLPVLIIETEDDGEVRSVQAAEGWTDAVERVVKMAWDDGYIGPDGVTEEELRKELGDSGCYWDGDVLTTIWLDAQNTATSDW